jgi:hypothetical protein
MVDAEDAQITLSQEPVPIQSEAELEPDSDPESELEPSPPSCSLENEQMELDSIFSSNVMPFTFPTSAHVDPYSNVSIDPNVEPTHFHVVPSTTRSRSFVFPRSTSLYDSAKLIIKAKQAPKFGTINPSSPPIVIEHTQRTSYQRKSNQYNTNSNMNSSEFVHLPGGIVHPDTSGMSRSNSFPRNKIVDSSSIPLSSSSSLSSFSDLLPTLPSVFSIPPMQLPPVPELSPTSNLYSNVHQLDPNSNTPLSDVCPSVENTSIPHQQLTSPSRSHMYPTSSPNSTQTPIQTQTHSSPHVHLPRLRAHSPDSPVHRHPSQTSQPLASTNLLNRSVSAGSFILRVNKTK